MITQKLFGFSGLGNRKTMDAKEFARFFGGFSTEKRVKLIATLAEAGKPGLTLIDLSRKTDLSVIDIGNAAEALLMMDLMNISVKGENKMLFLNFDVMSKLFDEAYHTFGQGRFVRQEEERAAAAAAELAEAAAEATAAPDKPSEKSTPTKA
jgi:hypothetical protein